MLIAWFSMMLLISSIIYQLKCQRKLHFYYYFIRYFSFVFAWHPNKAQTKMAIDLVQTQTIQNDCKIPLPTTERMEPNRNDDYNNKWLWRIENAFDVRFMLCFHVVCACTNAAHFVCCIRKYRLGESLSWHLPLNSYTNRFALYLSLNAPCFTVYLREIAQLKRNLMQIFQINRRK